MHDSYKCVSLDRRIPFFYHPSQYILDNIDNQDFQPTDKLEAGKILSGMANTQINLFRRRLAEISFGEIL